MQYNVIVVNCPAFPDRVIGFSYTDTAENWAETVEHCANVQTNEEVVDGGRIKRTYAVWADAVMTTVAFHRPASQTRPSVHDIEIYEEGEFTMPANQASATCATDGSNSSSTTDTDGGQDTTTPTECIDDATTPQLCLDKWVDEY